MRKLKGVVVSDKMSKAALVRVERLKTHPLYKKRFTRSRKFAVADPQDALKIGDVVEIVETRPISKTIHFKVEKVIGRAEEVVKELAEVDEEAKIRLERAKREEELRVARQKDLEAREAKLMTEPEVTEELPAEPKGGEA